MTPAIDASAADRETPDRAAGDAALLARALDEQSKQLIRETRPVTSIANIPIDAVDEVSSRPDFAVLCYSGYLKAKDRDELALGYRLGSYKFDMYKSGEKTAAPALTIVELKEGLREHEPEDRPARAGAHRCEYLFRYRSSGSSRTA